MSALPAPRPSRRSFLKLSAAAVAGALALRLPQLPPAAPGVSGLRLASALPRPGWPLLPVPEQLLQTSMTAYQPLDAALVPAYVAAMLIQAGRLQPLRGPAGRPHDPEGRFTAPYAYRVAALRYAGEAAAPETASWEGLWSDGGSGVWPAFGRVMTGAALLWRGYSPNDTHPGHLAQAAADLERLPPRRVSKPAGSLQTQPTVALVLADPAELGLANGLRLPVEGTLLIEYDWVITAGPARAAAARQFIDDLPPAVYAPLANSPARLIPLMPLPPASRAQHLAIWNDLAGRQPGSTV